MVAVTIIPVMMSRMGMIVIRVWMVYRLRRILPRAVRQAYIDFGGPHPTPVYRRDLDCHVGKAEPGRQRTQPSGRGTGGQKGTQQHVSADS
jgi:hypothetical protein